MSDLDWCLKQKKGIKLMQPSDNISNDYIVRAEKDLDALNNNVGHWKLITAYYACYDILYALLMKIGIKSEIHDCTIEIMSMLGFDNDEIIKIKKLKNDRIQVQYYLKDITLSDEIFVKQFYVKTKQKIREITEKDINFIREQLNNKVKEAK